MSDIPFIFAAGISQIIFTYIEDNVPKDQSEQLLLRCILAIVFCLVTLLAVKQILRLIYSLLDKYESQND